MYRRSDETQILGKKRQAPDGLAQLDEQVVAGPIDPAAVDGRIFGRGNLPELFEPAEVIATNVVAVLRGPSQALDPPLSAAVFHRIPPIQGISPPLTSLAEKIRGSSRDSLEPNL